MRCHGQYPEVTVPPFTVASAAPGSSAPPLRSPGAPPEEWLAWMADQPNLHDAITEAVNAGAGTSIIAYAVGRWEQENRADEMDQRISAMFARWGH